MSTPPSDPKNPEQPGAPAPWPGPAAPAPATPAPGAIPSNPGGGPSRGGNSDPPPLVAPTAWPSLPVPVRLEPPAVPPAVPPTAWPQVGPELIPPHGLPEGSPATPLPISGGYVPPVPSGGMTLGYTSPPLAPPPGYAPGAPQGNGPPQGYATRGIYELRNVVYRYPKGKFELRVPSLSILPGQLTYIGGETGCGKSTLLKLLALETVPSQGDVSIMGYSVKNLTQDQRDDLRGGGIVYLAQGDMGLQNLLPVENIKRLLYDFDGLPWEEAERRALDGLRVAQFPADRLDVKALDFLAAKRRVSRSPSFTRRGAQSV